MKSNFYNWLLPLLIASNFQAFSQTEATNCGIATLHNVSEFCSTKNHTVSAGQTAYWIQFTASSESVQLNTAINGLAPVISSIDLLSGSCTNLQVLETDATFSIGDSTVFNTPLTVGQTYYIKFNVLSAYAANFDACLIEKTTYTMELFVINSNGDTTYICNGIHFALAGSGTNGWNCDPVNVCVTDSICLSFQMANNSNSAIDSTFFIQQVTNLNISGSLNTNASSYCLTFNEVGIVTFFIHPEYPGMGNPWAPDHPYNSPYYFSFNVIDQTPQATPNQASTICLGGAYSLTTFPGTVLTSVSLNNVPQPIPDPAFWSTTLPAGQHIINYTVDGLCQPTSYSDTIIIIDTTDVSMTIDACNHASFSFQTCDVFTNLEFSDGLGNLIPITPVNGFATWTVDYSNISTAVTWTLNGWQQIQASPIQYGIVFTESQVINPAIPFPIATNAPSHLCDLTEAGISLTSPSGLQNIVWATSPATATFTGQGTTTIFPNAWSTTANNVNLSLTAVDSNGCHYSAAMVLQVCCEPDADGTEFFERIYANNAQLQTIANQLPTGYYNGPALPISINLPAPQALANQIATIYSAPTTLTTFISANPGLFASGPLETNNWIFFNHDFIVDKNLIINNTHFIRFAPGKRMLIQPGISVSVNNSTIAAKCDSMWGGIFIPDTTASLTVRNSNLVAAVKAVHSQNGGYYKITASKLIDNYASIWVENYPTLPTTSSVESTYFGDVVNQNLMAPYNMEAQPVYGVYIQKIRDIVVGPQTTTSLGNLFHNHKRGIHSLVSTVHVFRNTFFNIKRTTGTAIGQEYAAIFANGNLLSNHTLEVGNSVLTRNIFLNCESGVVSNKFMHLSAKNNYMKGCLLRGITAENNRLKNITIWNNEINSLNSNALAIYVKNYQLGSANIQLNYINANNPQPLAQPRFGAGIYVANEIGIATNQSTTINNNYIHNSIYGIWVLNISGARVDNNQVFYNLTNVQTNTLATVQKLRGILIQNSPKSEVNSNEISKTIGANIVSVPNENLQGIRLEFSPASNIRKNIMAKTPVGFYAKGSSLGSHVDCNKMISTRNGFFMDQADLSDQGAPVGNGLYPNGYVSNNEWIGTLSDRTEGSMGNLNYYYHSNPSIYNSQPSVLINNVWVDAPPVIAGANPVLNYCNQAINPLIVENQLTKRTREVLPIAQNSINFGILDYNQKHFLKLSTYSRLIQDSSLNNLGDSTDVLVENFVDSNFVTNSQTKILFDIQTALLQDDYQLALDLNTLLSDSCNQYSTNKDVQELMITRKINNAVFSAQDSTFLLGISCLDPLEFGSGVYQARALMDWNGDCTGSNNKSLLFDNSEVLENSSVILFPNPNDGKFKLISDSEISVIQVFNISGLIIKNYENVLSTELEFNLSLDAGIYLVKISMKDGEIIEQRIMIE